MRIIIYTRNDCVQCHATKRAMESRGFAFDMVNIDQHPEAIDKAARAGIPAITGGDGRGNPLVRLPPGYD